MRSALARLAVVLALCLSLGGHWAALQSIAWTKMIVEYSQRAPLALAIAQTLDGEHPCDLCKRINAAQHSPKKTDLRPLVTKPDLICTTRLVTLLPRFAFHCFTFPQVSLVLRVDSPPVPPPRFSLA